MVPPSEETQPREAVYPRVLQCRQRLWTEVASSQRLSNNPRNVAAALVRRSSSRMACIRLREIVVSLDEPAPSRHDRGPRPLTPQRRRYGPQLVPSALLGSHGCVQHEARNQVLPDFGYTGQSTSACRRPLCRRRTTAVRSVRSTGDGSRPSIGLARLVARFSITYSQEGVSRAPTSRKIYHSALVAATSSKPGLEHRVTSPRMKVLHVAPSLDERWVGP